LCTVFRKQVIIFKCLAEYKNMDSCFGFSINIIVYGVYRYFSFMTNQIYGKIIFAGTAFTVFVIESYVVFAG